MGLRTISLIVVLLSTVNVFAQTGSQYGRQHTQGLAWRNIGPVNMGGRIDDVAVFEKNPFVFYIGTASGGLWKTTNNGTTWVSLFDRQPCGSIGAVAISQSDHNLVWVGTGEANNRQSSTWGDGVYRSTDGGATWKHMGLPNSKAIPRIVIDPGNPNTVFIAALGSLFGASKERGVYRTTDGGASWQQTLFVNEDTGVTDLALDPANAKVLYAATYQRRRAAWGFNGGGSGSGIYKSSDGGTTWARLTKGLPEGAIGRIGLAVARTAPNTVYAVIEHAGAPGVYRSNDAGESWAKQSGFNSRPMYYSQLRVDPKNAEVVYLAALQLSRSEDGGKTFRSVTQFSVHTDHHAFWIDPNHTDHLLLGGDGGIHKSYDRGRSWDHLNTIPLAQFYAVCYDMREPYYVYGGLQDNGSWGAPSRTRSTAGVTQADWFRVGGGDGFYCQVDPSDHNIVYAESQNGGLLRLDLRTGRSTSIRPGGQRFGGGGRPPAVPAETTPAAPQPGAPGQNRFNWNSPLIVSPHNPRTIFFGGNMLFRSVNRGDTWEKLGGDLTKNIDRSKLSLMGSPSTEAWLSKHDGVSFYGTITSISQSPREANVIWVGTDDGNLQVTQDGGKTWANVYDNLPGVPKELWVTRVEASHHAAGTCYATVDGHRSDVYDAFIFKTTDFGKTWTSIRGNIDRGPAHVIREHPQNGEVLFVGTEFTVWASLDGGASWLPLNNGLPPVPVHDLQIHPRDGDLIAGTHGRGVFIMDDVSALANMNAATQNRAHLFDIRSPIVWNTDPTLGRGGGGDRRFAGANPPRGAVIHYYLGEISKDATVSVVIRDVFGNEVRSLTTTRNPGLNRVVWDLAEPPRQGGGIGGAGGGIGRAGAGGGGFAGPPVAPGDYVVWLTVGEETFTTRLRVRPDPGPNGSATD